MTLRIQIDKFDSLRAFNAAFSHIAPRDDFKFLNLKKTKIVYANPVLFMQLYKRTGNTLSPVSTRDEKREVHEISEEIDREVTSRKIGKEARKKGIVSPHEIAEIEQKEFDKERKKFYATCLGPAGVSLFRWIYDRYGSFCYCFNGYDDYDMKRFSPRRRTSLAEIKAGMEICFGQCMEVHG